MAETLECYLTYRNDTDTVDRRKNCIIILLVVLFVLPWFFCACVQKQAPAESDSDLDRINRSFVIGYCLNNIEDVFQIQILDAVKEAVLEAGGEIEISNADDDIVKQRNQVAYFAARKVDGLIVVPINEESAATTTAIAQDEGVPLCYINRNPYPNKNLIPKGVYVVSSEEVVAGRLQADYLGKLLHGGGNIVILLGPLDQQAAVERVRGNKEVLQERYPEIVVLAEASAEWQRDKAFTIMMNWLKQYGKQISAVIASNDEMAIGAIQALDYSGIDNVIVVGVDATIEGKVAIQQGTMVATVLQDAEGQGKTAARVIIDAIYGKEHNSLNIIPFDIIDKAVLDRMEIEE
ncbi:MAG: substrate-binding domain-containing protein [Treponema sp.]|uniref:substrate-binding domain-containing protein n=1 Tax=Treponema sp. TaxID=166 RepID=UPI003FA2F829